MIRAALPTTLAAIVLVGAADPLGGQTSAHTAKEAVLWSALGRDVIGRAERLDGVVGIAIEDLRTGATIAHGAELEFPQASSIKLAVLYELYRRAEAGELDLAEVVRPKGPRVAGAGVLYLLGPDVTMTWRDLAVLMMALSDNEATNLLIDRLGMDRVNARLDELGLRRTRLRRRMMDAAAAERDDENVSTPAEMVRLVKALRDGRGLSPALAADLRAVAAVEKDSDFRTPLPPGVAVMDKPGDLDGVRCVTAVVELPRRPYAVSIMTTYLARDTDGEDAIRDLSARIYSVFDRLDRAAPTGRIMRER